MKVNRGGRDKEETNTMAKEGEKKTRIDRDDILYWHGDRDNKNGIDIQVNDKTGPEKEKRQEISMEKKSNLGTKISICMLTETQAEIKTKPRTDLLIPILPTPSTQTKSKTDSPIPSLLRSTDQVGFKSRTLPKPLPSGKGKLMVVKLDERGLPLSGLHTNPHANSLTSMSEFSSHSFPNLRECSRM